MKSTSPHTYTTFSRSLHWLIALAFLCIWAAGYYMVSNQDYAIYSLHKQAGVVLLMLMVIRAAYRLKQGWPAPANQYKQWQQRLAKLTHWALLVLVLLVPLSGIAYSGLSGHGVYLFGLDIVPTNLVGPEQQVQAYSPIWEARAQTSHWVITYAFMGIVCVHIAGALKHHFMDRDTTLTRMINGSARAE